MAIFYLDYENGDDVNDGSDWANAWKTITDGATEARIAPGDIIRIAKSPAPSSIGNGTWTNLSKAVTLASAQTLTIDLCEIAWTGAGDTTIIRDPVAMDAKEGTYCMRLTVDASPQASILQAYYATGEIDLSSYQKVSFWIKNGGVIVADNWIVCLCSDIAGADVVDSFLVPAIPSTNEWLPLTLTKDGGGNLGASIKSIAIYSGGTTTGMASKWIRVDDFIACTTSGLNLQSLISKNSAEQGGTEGWYGIQSINGTTVLLDDSMNTKSDAGRGYSGITETVTTYIRETIKTDLVSGTMDVVQEIQDSGTLGSNIEFQGGYNTSTTIQDGETFFDGLNGNGKGINSSGNSYITLNFLNVTRYYYGIYFGSNDNITITTLSNANNNASGLYWYRGSNNTIVTLSNLNNNTFVGASFYECLGMIIGTVSSMSNNGNHGLKFESCYNCFISTLSNVNNNLYAGIYHYASNNIVIRNASNIKDNEWTGLAYELSTDNAIASVSLSGNGVGVVNGEGKNYLRNVSIAEATEVDEITDFANSRLFSQNHDKGSNHRIFTDGGQIDSVTTDRPGGTGIMWKLAITSANRVSYYPLDLKIAKIAVLADKLVTVKVYMKKSHATNIGGKLVCRGGQIAGVTSDVVDTKADDTDWEELEITFTPSEIGVVEIEAWAYYSAANGDVYVEDMTIAQAD